MSGFPDGFVWGAASAALQVEGSLQADGSGMSTWQTFARTPGNVHNGDTPETACDHYRLWASDVAIMQELGLRGYRFSISWPRILPTGAGHINGPGLDFYDALVDELLGAGIAPFVTLHHWELPVDLQDIGGWANRDVASRFGDFADAVFVRLGDRVRQWITLNEPWVTANHGYVKGNFPPGVRDLRLAFRVVHHELLGHGLAVAACRARKAGEIGITNVLSAVEPASDSDPDTKANERMVAYHNRLFLDPLFGRGYPDILRERFAWAWPDQSDDDLTTIAQPIDFLGINYYFGPRVADAPGEGLLDVKTVERDVPTTEMGWGIHPAGLYQILRWVHDTYDQPSIYITENGAAFADVADASGYVEDDNRVDFLRRHFIEAHRAISDGVDLRGYFVWTLMDNFEWTHGYSKRFGLVRVDYETQSRTIKKSGRWYTDVIRNNRVSAAEPALA